MGPRETISAARVAELEQQLAVSEAARIAAETRLAASEDALARLERMIAQLRREKFGTKSEKTTTDLQHLPFEDIEVAEGMLAAASEEVEKALGDRNKKTPHGETEQGPSARPSGAD